MTRMSLGEAFMLNPKVALSKGAIAPFVEMSSIKPFTRDVCTEVSKSYSGGAKFEDSDVLMARITPSLENGKTSIYRATDTGPAFGSTEFIVIRGREGISDSAFAYYFVTSPEVREHAIASMNGSSGRQRVQHDSLADFEFNLPSIEEQRAIAATLGTLDDKIESNRRSVGLATQLAASTLLSGSHSVRLGEVASLSKGLSYKGAGLVDRNTDDATPMINLGNFTTSGSIKEAGLKFYSGEHKPKHLLQPWELVVANTDLTQARELLGRGFLVPSNLAGALHTHHTTLVRFTEQPGLGVVLWAHLQTSEFRDRAKGFATGTTVAALPPEALLDFEIRIPDDLDDSLSYATGLIERAWAMAEENARITKLRDSLLPELLSGRIRVPVEGTAA